MWITPPLLNAFNKNQQFTKILYIGLLEQKKMGKSLVTNSYCSNAKNGNQKAKKKKNRLQKMGKFAFMKTNPEQYIRKKIQ